VSTGKIPDDDLLGDLEQVAASLGHPPTVDEYNARGEHSYTTLRRRFGGWDAALASAGLDPERRRGIHGGGMRVACPHCGSGFNTTGDGPARCPHCQRRTPLHRAVTHHFASHDAITTLATGPATGAELTNSPSPSRFGGLVRKLAPPGGKGGGHGPARSVSTVYYLTGDERAAVRRFIEENTEYVQWCLGDEYGGNPLKHDWQGALYETLYEQWAWMDVGGSDAADATGDGGESR
jgi:hypothetical protein